MALSKKTAKYMAWAGGILLLVLHLDFWRPQRVEVYFGWVPEELLYRIGWMILAWAYLDCAPTHCTMVQILIK